jgi:hypothetical protein
MCKAMESMIYHISIETGLDSLMIMYFSSTDEVTGASMALSLRISRESVGWIP